MKMNHSYGVNIFTIVIVFGALQLIWPWSPWLILYRFVAAACLFFMLFVVIFRLLIANDRRFGRKQIRQNKPLKFSIFIRPTFMLLFAWLMKDPWAWWLTVSVVILSLGLRWMALDRSKSCWSL